MNTKSQSLSQPLRGFLIALSFILLQLSVPLTENASFAIASKETRLKTPISIVKPIMMLFASAQTQLKVYQETAELVFKETEDAAKTFKIVKVETKKEVVKKPMWPVRGAITSKYGMRKHPITGRYAFHNGIDIRAKKGTKIACPTEAMVVDTGYVGALGRMVKVKTSSGHILCFAHLSQIKCKKGQKLNRGQLLGTVGSTGRSTGPHLHFAVSYGGKTLNPTKYLAK